MQKPIGGDAPRRPRIFYGWYIVAASAVLNAYVATAFAYGLQVFFLPILREFGWTRAAMSAAFSLRQVESGIIAPVLGFLVDRVGARPMILLGVILSGAGLILMSFITSLWMFYLALIIASMGVSGASHGVTWPAVVVRWFRRLRGRAMGLALSGPIVGGPAVVLVALLEQSVGWRAALQILGIGFWVIGIPTALVARSRPEDYGLKPDGDPAPIEELPRQMPARAATEANRAIEATGVTVGEALRSKDFWGLALIFGVQGLGVSSLLVHQLPYFESRGFNPAVAASTVGIMTAVSGIGRIGAGALLDLLDWRLVMAGILGVQALAFLVLAGASAYWQASLFAGLLGLSFGAAISARPTMVGILFGIRAFGSIQGLMQAAAIAAGVVGPVMLGWIFDVYGTYTPGVLGLAVITAGAIPLSFLVLPSGSTERG